MGLTHTHTHTHTHTVTAILFAAVSLLEVPTSLVVCVCVCVCVWMGIWSVSVFLTALPRVVDPAECLGVDGCISVSVFLTQKLHVKQITLGNAHKLCNSKLLSTKAKSFLNKFKKCNI